MIYVNAFVFGSNVIEIIIAYLDNALLFYIVFLVTLLWSIYIIFSVWFNCVWFNKTLTSNVKLDLLWTIMPVIFIWFGIYQSVSMLFSVALVSFNSNIIVNVLAYQWYWVYNWDQANIFSKIIKSNDLILGMPSLIVTEQPLFVPLFKNVTFVVTANDVMHCWAIPSLGINVDAIPGSLTSINMIPLNVGLFSGFCFELCGIGHSFMPIIIIIYNT